MQEAADLRAEVSDYQKSLSEWIEELTNTQNASDVVKDQLEKSRKTMRTYRMTLAMLRQTAEELNKNLRQLHERGQGLANVITKR